MSMVIPPKPKVTNRPKNGGSRKRITRWCCVRLRLSTLRRGRLVFDDRLDAGLTQHVGDVFDGRRQRRCVG